MDDKDDEVEVEPLELPDIPDYPEAPLPAWKHYGITNFASQKIVEELENVQYSGYMVGLEVGYSLEEEKKTYAMSFGKVRPSEEELEQQGEEPDLPISDEFLVRLYQTIHDYMKANGSENLSPELTIVITGSLKAVTVMCRTPQVCDRRHGGKRWCKKVNSGPWTCLHSSRCT